jgi:hypothetical protein
VRRIFSFALLLCLGTAPVQAGRRELKVRDAGGHEAFTIKWEETGAKLVDPHERELARIKPHADRIKIEDAADVLLGALTGDAEKLSIKSAEKNVLFVLRRHGDGYKLEDAHDLLLAKLERKGPDEVRAEDGAGKTLFKAKRKHGKLVLTNSAEAPVLTTDGAASLMGFAIFGLDRLSQPQQAAIFWRLDALAVP